MALWKPNFTTEDEDLCATRILDAWDKPNYCPTYIQPAGFGHVCRLNDRHIQGSVAKVKQTMTNTTMLNDIIEAHQPHTSSTEANTSTTVDSSFFFHAGGQEDSHELTEIHQHGDEDDQDYEEPHHDDQDHYENEEDNSDRDTENSDQDNEEYNNFDQDFSDNDSPYDGEGSNEDD